MVWQAADAVQRFGDMLEAAAVDGPQSIARGDVAVAVLLSAAEFHLLKQQADQNFAALLAQSPFGPEDVEPVGMSLAGGS